MNCSPWEPAFAFRGPLGPLFFWREGMMKKTFPLLALSFYCLGSPGYATTSPYTAYYGLTHSHTASNGDDGTGTIDDAFRYARQKGQLDFFVYTPHCRALTPDDYNTLIATAQKYNQDDQFVTLPGQEWGSLSKGGHVNIFGASELCQVTPGDWSTLYQTWLPAHPEISWIALNHPRKTDFAPDLLASKPSVSSKITTIATICSHSEYPKEDGKAPLFFLGKTYRYFLNQGFIVGAGGDQDNHGPNWGTSSQVQTGVWASKLTKTEIIKAFQAHRTFSTRVSKLKLWFTLNGLEMGSEGNSTRAMKFTVTLQDPSKETTKLYLYGDTDGLGNQDAKALGKSPVQNGQANWTYNYKAPQKGPMYFYVRAISKDGDTAFSSPIWINVQD